MKITCIASEGADQLSACLSKIDDSQVEALEDAILSACKIYVMGAGRTMLMLRCLAMRLMHLGLRSYVVGDTTTPAFEAGDLLIVASGSGTTGGVVAVAEKARSLGGTIAVVTIRRDSPLGSMADVLVEVPAYTDKVHYEGLERPLLPGGSLFEQSVLLLGDSLVIPISEREGIPTDRMFALHANLE